MSETVYMKFNHRGAKWEQISQDWATAVLLLGEKYRLKKVAQNGTETEREPKK
jgi:hypothetical protein